MTGPRRDEYVPVLEWIRAKQLLNRPILTPPCKDQDQAEHIRKGLYLSARYYCSCGQRACTRKHNNLEGCPRAGDRLSCRADIVRDKKGRLRVQLTVFDKREAIRATVAKYGPDPSKWPYQAKARRLET